MRSDWLKLTNNKVERLQMGKKSFASGTNKYGKAVKGNLLAAFKDWWKFGHLMGLFVFVLPFFRACDSVDKYSLELETYEFLSLEKFNFNISWEKHVKNWWIRVFSWILFIFLIKLSTFTITCWARVPHNPKFTKFSYCFKILSCRKLSTKDIFVVPCWFKKWKENMLHFLLENAWKGFVWTDNVDQQPKEGLKNIYEGR